MTRQTVILRRVWVTAPIEHLNEYRQILLLFRKSSTQDTNSVRRPSTMMRFYCSVWVIELRNSRDYLFSKRSSKVNNSQLGYKTRLRLLIKALTENHWSRRSHTGVLISLTRTQPNFSIAAKKLVLKQIPCACLPNATHWSRISSDRIWIFRENLKPKLGQPSPRLKSVNAAHALLFPRRTLWFLFQPREHSDFECGSSKENPVWCCVGKACLIHWYSFINIYIRRRVPRRI